ncbi:MAG: type II toxin-antitoxin system RelE/ParE family toxin [Dehalococcoidia bacterium]
MERSYAGFRRSTMAEIRWSPAAERAAFRLPVTARRGLLEALDRLRVFPESGVMVEEGRYRGHRRVLIRPHWFLYYRVTGSERTCILRMNRDARRDRV